MRSVTAFLQQKVDMKWVIVTLSTCVGILAGTVAHISLSAPPKPVPRIDPTRPIDITFRLYTDCLDPYIINARELPSVEDVFNQDKWCVHWAANWSIALGGRKLTTAEAKTFDTQREQYLVSILSMINEVVRTTK